MPLKIDKNNGINYEELLEKYRLLLDENSRLKDENNRLKTRLGLPLDHPSIKHITEIPAQTTLFNKEPNVDISPVVITNTSDSISKIKLFMSLFIIIIVNDLNKLTNLDPAIKHALDLIQGRRMT